MDSSELTLAAAYQRARREFGDSQVVSRIDGTVVTHSYTELFARVDRLAWAFTSLGIGPGDRVGTLAWNHHRHLEIYLAATSCGAVLHTINLRLPADSAIGIARHAGDKVIFVDADQAGLLEAVATAELSNLRTVVRMGAAGADLTATRVPVLDYESLLAGQPEAAFGYPELHERMPAATCYSSATTGIPKGVVYSHRGLLMHSMTLALADTWAISRRDTVLPVVPMFHVNAWGLPFTVLWMGSRLVLPGARPAAADLLDLLVRQRVTFAAAVPTVWMDVLRLVRAQGRPLPSLRMVVSGGAPLPRTLLEDADDLDIPMIHSYGMTEAAPLVLVGQSQGGAASAADPMLRRLRQGAVVPGLDYRVVDDDGNSVPRDGATPGELQLRGPWVAEEYERDARSAAAFCDGWYHTGDIVNVDEGGYLKVVDRVADVIKSGGEWISTVDLENALMDHPAVRSAAVIGVPDERWQERPRAYVVLDSDATGDQLREFLMERFPKFWVPDVVQFLPEIPLTSVGKFDKKALRQRVQGESGLA